MYILQVAHGRKCSINDYNYHHHHYHNDAEDFFLLEFCRPLKALNIIESMVKITKIQNLCTFRNQVMYFAF